MREVQKEMGFRSSGTAREHIDSFELTDAIHEFHNGPARRLWKSYNDLTPDVSVALALRSGILNESEVPERIRSKLPTLPEPRRPERR